MEYEPVRNLVVDGLKALRNYSARWRGCPPDHSICLEVERTEQVGSSVGQVVRDVPFALAGTRRQQRLGTVQRSDLGYFIDAKDQSGHGSLKPSTRWGCNGEGPSVPLNGSR